MLNKTKKILLVQDMSCVGRCSLTVALPVMSCMGIQVIPFPTMLLSAHTGFKNVYKRDLTDDLEPILRHIEELDVGVDAVYIGYIAGAGQLPVIDRALSHFLAGDTKLYVDPVMGDEGRLYPGITKGVVEGFRGLCQRADVIFPNRTEAAFLLEETASSSPPEEILRQLVHLGAKAAVLTGVPGKIALSVPLPWKRTRKCAALLRPGIRAASMVRAICLPPLLSARSLTGFPSKPAWNWRYVLWMSASKMLRQARRSACTACPLNRSCPCSFVPSAVK